MRQVVEEYRTQKREERIAQAQNKKTQSKHDRTDRNQGKADERNCVGGAARRKREK